VLRRWARHGNADRAGLRTLTLSLLVLALAGCGGEDEEGFPAGVSQPATKVEFLREADRICVSSEARIEAAADDLLRERGAPHPEQVERVALGIAVPALETEVRAIGSLTPPEGDEAEIEAILDATERGIAQIEADPRRLADGPPPGLREAQRLAERYGSTECGFPAG
jgi:hypothetical protein